MKNELHEKVKEYFYIETGIFIESPEEMIYVCDFLLESKKYKVYFKNRIIKHFVERRKEDLMKRNSEIRSLEIILGMTEDLSVALVDYTKVENNTKRLNSYLVYKNFSDPGKTPVTVVLESDEDRNMLIISYYFTKR